MLQNLEITNYQAHRSTSIEFHSGLNVITGVSDHGKSSILRAILWAINNRPMGEDFKSWGADEKDVVEVALEFDNDWFSKKREKGKNTYMHEGLSRPLEAIRTDVPEEIQEIHNMSDLNVQTQIKPYFMLPDTPGDRAKQINKLTGLDIIDSAIKKANKQVSDAKSDIDITNKAISKVTNELKELEYLDAVSFQVSKLDDDITKQMELTLRANLMRSLRDKLIVISDKIKEETITLNQEKTYLHLTELLKQVTVKGKQLDQLRSIKENLTTIKEKLKKNCKILKQETGYLKIENYLNDRYKKVTAKNELVNFRKNLVKIKKDIQDDTEWLLVEPLFLKLKDKISKYKNLMNEKDDICSYQSSMTVFKYNYEQATNDLQNLTTQYTEILEKSGICPTCMSKINAKTVDQIKAKFEV